MTTRGYIPGSDFLPGTLGGFRGLGRLGSEIAAASAAAVAAGEQASPLANDGLVSTKEYRWVVTAPAGATAFEVDDLGGLDYTGPAPASGTYKLWEDGVAQTLNGSADIPYAVTAATAPDTTAPTLSGSIAVSGVTASGWTMTWSAGADNVGVVAYDYSTDGGSTYSATAGTTAAISGKAPGTTYQLRVRARDAAGKISVALTGTATTLVQITTQPQSQSVTSGSSVTFSLAFTGTASGLQWRKGGVNIAGATSATYTIGTVAGGSAGSYDAVITNAGGSVTSSAATLTVNAPTNAAPTWPAGAAVGVANITATGATVAWPMASDDVGVAGYDVSIDGGATWPIQDVIGQSTTATWQSSTLPRTFTISVRAQDLEGLYSPVISASISVPAVVVGGGGTPTTGPAATRYARFELLLSRLPRVPAAGVTVDVAVLDAVRPKDWSAVLGRGTVTTDENGWAVLPIVSEQVYRGMPVAIAVSNRGLVVADDDVGSDVLSAVID